MGSWVAAAEWDFDGDEALFLMAALVVATAGLIGWVGLMRVWPRGRAMRCRLALLMTPLVGLGALLVVLQRWADPKSVIGHADYILLFMAGGAAWVVLAAMALRIGGIHYRADVVERNNVAAAVCACGWMAGMLSAYIYCNIGGGPTIWTTIVPALAACATLAVLWGLVNVASGCVEAIVVDRDLASGWRMGAFAVGAGLILGRAMAGDFVSWGGTFRDFGRLGWPAVVLAVAVGIVNRICAPTPQQPRPDAVWRGIVPGIGLVVLAIGVVISLGPPEVAR